MNSKPVRVESTNEYPAIFKLTFDCCDEIFEYLSLQDLHSFGETCKIFQKIAGEYFHRNYMAGIKHTDTNGIFMTDPNNAGNIDFRVHLPAFNQFITKFTRYFTHEPLKYIKKHSDELISLINIDLCNIRLQMRTIDCIRKLLPKVEILSFRGCKFYEFRKM